MSGGAKRWANFILAAVATIFSLGILEVGLRVAFPRLFFLDYTSDTYWNASLEEELRAKGTLSPGHDQIHDPDLGWVGRPNFRDPGGVTLNAEGLRASREYTQERVDGVGRVMLLGDSFTFGMLVKDEETFGAQLEARLAPRLGEVEVINAGVCGYGTDQAYLYWKKRGHTYRPDVVVLGLFVDDFVRTGLSNFGYLKPKLEVVGGELVVRNTPIPVPESLTMAQLPPARDGLRLFSALAHFQRKARWKSRGEWQPPERFDATAEVIEHILKDLDADARAKGAKLVVLLFPTQDYDLRFDSVRIERAVTEASQRQGVLLVDLKPKLLAWDEAHPDDRAYNPATYHWSPAGHGVAADALFEVFEREGLLGLGAAAE